MGRTAANYVRERTADEWRSLTGGQRSAWWDFAGDHPITYKAGQVKLLNAWQMFNYVNCQLAVADYRFLVMDAPTMLDLPGDVPFTLVTWPLKSKLADTSSRYHGRLVVNFETAVPENRVIIFYHTAEKYPRMKTAYRTRNTQKIRGAVVLPGTTGQVDLGIEGGMPLFPGKHSAGLQGNYARILPNYPRGHYRVVSTVNGMYTQFPLTL